jgi:uncharacterized coiled-coil DUF342 family protein
MEFINQYSVPLGEFKSKSSELDEEVVISNIDKCMNRIENDLRKITKNSDDISRCKADINGIKSNLDSINNNLTQFKKSLDNNFCSFEKFSNTYLELTKRMQGLDKLEGTYEILKKDTVCYSNFVKELKSTCNELYKKAVSPIDKGINGIKDGLKNN